MGSALLCGDSPTLWHSLPAAPSPSIPARPQQPWGCSAILHARCQGRASGLLFRLNQQQRGNNLKLQPRAVPWPSQWQGSVWPAGAASRGAASPPACHGQGGTGTLGGRLLRPILSCGTTCSGDPQSSPGSSYIWKVPFGFLPGRRSERSAVPADTEPAVPALPPPPRPHATLGSFFLNFFFFFFFSCFPFLRAVKRCSLPGTASPPSLPPSCWSKPPSWNSLAD